MDCLLSQKDLDKNVLVCYVFLMQKEYDRKKQLGEGMALFCIFIRETNCETRLYYKEQLGT